MKEDKSSFTKLILPIVVIVVLVTIFVVSKKTNDTPTKEPLQNPEANGTGSEIVRTEVLNNPHPFIEDSSAGSCKGCHSQQYNDWRESPHALATSSEPFRLVLADLFKNSNRFNKPRTCFACHAPYDIDRIELLDNGSLDMESISGEGINCLTCHSSNFRIGMCLLQDYDLNIQSPDDPEFCAACHNRTIPLVILFDPDFISNHGVFEPGNPYAEWLNSEHSQPGENYKSCLDCHGREGTGTHHRWPEDKSEMLKQAYTIGELSLDITDRHLAGHMVITNTGAGHMLPTGDPGRMLTVELMVTNRSDSSESAIPIHQQTFYLGIQTDEHGGMLDNRLAPGESIDLTVHLDDPPDNLENLTLEYRIYYGFDTLMDELLNKRFGLELESVLMDEGA